MKLMSLSWFLDHEGHEISLPNSNCTSVILVSLLMSSISRSESFSTGILYIIYVISIISTFVRIKSIFLFFLKSPSLTPGVD